MQTSKQKAETEDIAESGILLHFRVTRSDHLDVEEPGLHGIHLGLPLAEVIHSKVQSSLGHEVGVRAVEFLTTWKKMSKTLVIIGTNHY